MQHYFSSKKHTVFWGGGLFPGWILGDPGGWVVPGLQAFTPHLSRGNPVHFAPFDPSPCTDSPPFTTPLHPSPQIQPGPPRTSSGILCMSH